MIKLLVGGLALLAAENGAAQGPVPGAWGATQQTEDGAATQLVVLFTRHHQVAAWFDGQTGKLVSTNGGTWKRVGDSVTETVEFDSLRPERVGSSLSFRVEVTDRSFSIPEYDMHIERIGEADQDALNGAWERVEVKQNDEWRNVRSDSTKTVRLMFAGRYQEIVFNPASGELLRTEGGTYQLTGYEYVERVLFAWPDAPVAEARKFRAERDHDVWYLLRGNAKGESWRLR